MIFSLFFKISAKPFVFRCPFIIPTFKTISVLASNRKNHYEALGVSRNATQADIKAAYYKLSMLYHPDRNETVEASESFRAITEAYEVVGNFKLRKLYDKGLLGRMDAEGSTRQNYTNYNPASSTYKNKPTHHGRSNVFNFDQWSRSHYADSFTKRSEARIRYEKKVNSSDSTRKENAVLLLFGITFISFYITYTLNAYDKPNPMPQDKFLLVGSSPISDSPSPSPLGSIKKTECDNT